MIEAKELTKRYGEVTAVDDVSFTVRPGMVTGFLGRNGAGKSTTMRMIVGLHRPTSGSVTVAGHQYRDLPVPVRQIGTLLDARAVHPGMSARGHLRALAASSAIGAERVDEVLDMVGLSAVATRRAGTFSLGMGQRLGIAAALLGDPQIVMFDEPLNGLDPDGVHWLRGLLRQLADQGRTVFFSSHLMSEMALVADRLIILHRGRIVTDTTLTELLQQHSDNTVSARVPDAVERRTLTSILQRRPGVEVADEGNGAISVSGVTPTELGLHAREVGVALAGLTERMKSLEDVFMDVTNGTQARPEDQATT